MRRFLPFLVFFGVLLVFIFSVRSSLSNSVLGQSTLGSLIASVLGDNSGSGGGDDNDSDEDNSSDDEDEDDKDEDDSDDDEDEDSNSGSGSSGGSLDDDEDEVEDEDLDDLEDEDELDDEDDDESEIEIEGDEVRFNSRSGVSGRSTLEVKSKSDLGKIEIRVREDGRIEVKIKAEDGADIGDLLSQVFEPSEVQTILSLISSDGSGKGELEIKLDDEGSELEIQSNSHSASVKYPLSVDPETNTLAVQTPSGNVTLVILPDVAIENLLKNNKIDVIDSAELEEVSGKSGEEPTLEYRIRGTRNVRFFGLFPASPAVEVSVDSQTGEVTSETRPWYLRIFGFLYSNS